MVKRILIYIFPFFLLVIEAILRAILSLDTKTFVGPTLAAVGIGFVIPLIKPRQRDYNIRPDLKATLIKEGFLLISKRVEIFIDFVWLFTFIFTGCWACTLYLSNKLPDYYWLGIPAYLFLGLLCYFGGVVFSEIREVI